MIIPRRLISIITLCLFLIIGCSQTPSERIPPRAVKGVLNLGNWDFEKDGPVRLDGEWEFFWKELRESTGLSGINDHSKHHYIDLPNHWNDYRYKGTKLPHLGYATFHLTIIADQFPGKSAFKLKEFFSNYKLIVNGDEVTSVGAVGSSKRTSIPDNLPQVAELETSGNRLEVYLQVSNFHYHRGGPIRDITFGSADQINRLVRNQTLTEVFLFGSILIMGLYHLGLYLVRRKDKSPLFFGVFCIIIAGRLLLTGQTLLLEFFPGIGYEVMVRMIHSAFYLSVPLFVLFVYSLFPQEFNRKILTPFLILVGVVQSIVWTTPALIHTNLMRPYQLVTLLILGYALITVLIAIRRKREGAVIFVTGILILLLTAVNDILFNNNIIQTGYYAPYGFFGFIFSQAFLLSKKFSKAFSTVEAQKSALTETNLAYENEIVERKKAEDKFRSIFENSTGGIFQLTTNGRIITANPAATRILGYADEREIVAKLTNIDQHVFADPKEFKTLYERIERDSFVEGFESRINTKNGSEKYLLINARKVTDASGSTQYYEGNVDDITEKKQAEALKIERDAADAANRAKSEFLANMSHEIRTPMNAIMGFAEIINGKVTDNSIRQQLAAIISGGKTLLRIINDILDLSKIEAGKLEIQPGVVSLKNTIFEIRQMFSFKLKEQQQDLITELDPELPEFLILDETRFSQILFNLVGNAVKFSDEGPIKLTGLCGEKKTDSPEITLILKVEDKGIGIPPDQQSRIFDAFAQRKGQNYAKFGGTGLGLAITKRLVETMGGTISVRSNPGEGSCFEVNLPDIPVADPEEHVKDKEVSDYRKTRFESATILIADDVKENRELLKSYLEDQNNLNLIEAENGREALRMLEENQPDLILMDMKMPELSGYEAIERIRMDESRQRIPIIAVSASAMFEEESRFKKSGADDFIRKPLSKADLFACLVKYLDVESGEKLQDNTTADILTPQDTIDKAGNPTTREDLIALRDFLTSQVFERWQNLKERMIMDEIMTFAISIIEAGKTFNWKRLSDWGQSIHQLSDDFDVKNLTDQLNRLPELIDILNKTIDKDSKGIQ